VLAPRPAARQDGRVHARDRRLAPATAIALAVLFAMAGPAYAASTVTAATFGVTYTGDAGVNSVTFTDAAAPGMGMTRVTISETGVVAGAGCVQQVNAAYCDIGDTDSVTAQLAAGNDVATSNGTRVRYSFEGEGDDDTLTGADADQGAFLTVGDTLDGGPGRDMLFGRGGDDFLSGDEGDGDVAEGGEGRDSFSVSEEDGVGDVLRGGPNFDSVGISYFGPDPPIGGNVDLAAGTAAVAGASARLESIEDASGTDGNDLLLGSSGVNQISGDEGNDTVDGRDGADRLKGDAGDDRLEGRDGFFDLLTGGSGSDTCDADQLDVLESCEAGALVQLPPFGSPPPPDRAGPTCAVSELPARVPARRMRRRGLQVSATCDEAGRLAARLLAKFTRAGGGPAASAVGDLELAGASRAVAPGQPVRLRLRIARKLRPLVKRGARLRLELGATDAAGNERITTRRMRIR
jgi:Ca2+-binding RTX toxin-like protein